MLGRADLREITSRSSTSRYCLDTANLPVGYERIMRCEATNDFALKSLNRLVLGNVFSGPSTFEDPNTNANLICFLEKFNTICDIGPLCAYPKDPSLCYVLITNHMGRRLLENCSHDDDNDVGSGKTSRYHGTVINKSRLPDSVWPLALRESTLPYYNSQERYGFEITESPTYNTTCGNSEATGIYYPLREGPVLLDNHAPNRFSGVSNGQNKNDDNDRTEKPPP